MTEAGWPAGKDVKEIGWYWWRLHPHRMKVVEVVQDYEGGPLRSYVNGMWIYLEQSGAEWLGPLSPDDKAQGRVEGLREAEKYALRCLKELQDKIRDLESGKCVLAGAQTKEGVEAWVHAKTLEASRIAKWITARIIEQQAQDEKGVGHANG